MSTQDLHSNIDERLSHAIQTINTDTVTAGAIIDTAGYESLEFIVQAGIVTTGDITASLQDGDDSGLSDVATVDSAFVLGDFVTVDTTNQLTRIGVVSKKRYVRMNLTSANSANLLASAIAVLSNPGSAPVAQ